MQAPQMSPYTGTMITTELIQKYLDENKQLILAILDNQNLGKLHECAAYQSKLQQNLMYLAAIADAQPQAPIPTAQIPSMQTMPGSMLQANAQYMQQQQQHQMTPPPLLGQQQQPPVHYMQTPQMALHQAHQAQQQQQHQQQQQRMGLAVSGGMHNEIDLGANMSTMGGFPDYAAAHANSSGGGGNAGDGRTGGGGASASGGAGGDLRAAVTGGGGSDKPNSSQAAGDGVNGDDAGSTFLKASEED